MRLQLDTGGIQSAHSAYATEASSNSAARSNAGALSGGSDSVGLSGASRALRTADAAHSEKIARLTQQVRSGSYNVSPALVGRAIVSQAGSSGTSAGL